MSTRAADPFYISEETKKTLAQVYPYWKGKTTSELAEAYMAPETLRAIDHNIFTPGNYFYNGIGHLTVDYGKILEIGFDGLIVEAAQELEKHSVSEEDYPKRREFLESVIISCRAASDYAARYADLAEKTARAEGEDVYKRQTVERVPLSIDQAVEAAKYKLEEQIAQDLLPGSELEEEEVDYKQIDDETIEVTVTMRFTEKIGGEVPLAMPQQEA